MFGVDVFDLLNIALC